MLDRKVGRKKIPTSLMIVIIFAIIAAGVGVYFLVTQTDGPEEDEEDGGEPTDNLPPPDGQGSGPYYHQIYSATSTDGAS